LLSGGENYCPSYAEYGFVLLNSSEGINMPPNDLPTGYDFFFTKYLYFAK
jgi:hypothetical protein